MGMEEKIAKVVDASLSRSGIVAVYLMGSAATGKLRPDSDIDIALLPAAHCRIPVDEQVSFSSALALELGREVDLGVITSSNLVYASEAILKGKRILAVDPEYVSMTETRLLGCYLSFREDRRVVEEAYGAA